MRTEVTGLVRNTLEPIWVGNVREFQTQKIAYAPLPSSPVSGLPAEDRLELVTSLTEEYNEFVESANANDVVEMADAIVDMIYVLIGSGLRLGLPMGALFAEVHASNMEKYPAAPGTKGRKQADGSSMKPEGWQKPRIAEILDEYALSQWETEATIAMLQALQTKRLEAEMKVVS